MYTLKDIRAQVANEAACFRFIQGLQNDGDRLPELLSKVEVNDRDHAIERGVRTAHIILGRLNRAGMGYEDTDAGHGLGHVVRDYVNGLRLVTKLDADPASLFVGFVAGVLHDSACAVVRRYDERQSAVKHAGFAACIIDDLWRSCDDRCGLNQSEKRLIEYGIAAHTHLLKPMEATGKDGIRRILDPYIDTAPNGKPYLAVWLPRWIDRLDVNGPSFAARHYLTLADAHEDYANGGYYPIEYAAHMRPLLRSNEEIKADGNRRTMLEHLTMFNKSQTNASPYGKHDFGAMMKLREDLAVHADRITNAVTLSCELTVDEVRRILRAWTEFLAVNVEPHPLVGRPTAGKLEGLFLALPDATRQAWANGFESVMSEYCRWSRDVLDDLDHLDAMPPEWMRFQHIADVRDIIRPKRTWTVPLGFADRS